MTKNILITGSGGILGTAFIKEMLQSGHKVSACEVDIDKVDVLKNKFKNEDKFFAYKCDVTNENDVKKFFNESFHQMSSIDVVVNNAAVTSELLLKDNLVPKSFEETSLKSWQMSLDVNLTGTFLVSREFVRILKKNDLGSHTKKIINIASMYALNGPDPSLYENSEIKSFAAYSASKGGVIGLTKWLSTFLAKKNITVNSLAPGGVFNDHPSEFKKNLENKIPLGRMASPDEISSALSFLISENSDYITGQVIYCDGGYTAL